MLHFSKYQGLGNDFIVVDALLDTTNLKILTNNTPLIKKICDRKFGVGADGIIIACASDMSSDICMRIFNSDGTEAEMCGNGIRCLTKFLNDINFASNKKEYKILTKAGLIHSVVEDDGQIKVNMGLPQLEPSNIPTTFQPSKLGLPKSLLNLDGSKYDVSAVGMGNPHLIVAVDNIDNVPLEDWGAQLEHHEDFPESTNVHFAQIIDRNNIKVIVWERGCGPTLACGTGACAVLVASYLNKLTDPTANIQLPGGTLRIDWPSLNSPIYMKGEAEFVYKGSYSYKSINI